MLPLLFPPHRLWSRSCLCRVNAGVSSHFCFTSLLSLVHLWLLQQNCWLLEEFPQSLRGLCSLWVNAEENTKKHVCSFLVHRDNQTLCLLSWNKWTSVDHIYFTASRTSSRWRRTDLLASDWNQIIFSMIGPVRSGLASMLMLFFLILN